MTEQHPSVDELAATLEFDTASSASAGSAAAAALSAGSSTGSDSSSDRVARQLVLGKSSGLASETRQLLQSRLRSALGLLLVGFTLFLVRGFFIPFPWDIRLLHLSVMAALGGGVAILSLRQFSMSTLRWIEVGTFVGVNGYLMCTEAIQLQVATMEQDRVALINTVKGTLLFTVILLSIYCMFIPNRWQRAAPMVAFLALSPIAVLLGMRTLAPEFRHLAQETASWAYTTENLLILVTASVVAVFGTHVINRLRREVFEARQFGQYQLRQKIGRGGMGEVYLAEHQLMRRPCAIKVIRPERSADRNTIARFAREVRAAARLSHWNTVQVYDYGQTDDGVFFYVMELLQGLSFQELVDCDGPLPESRAIYLIRQICDALHEAETVRLVHRDIKPTNLFAVERGGHCDVAKLTDFGLVKTSEFSDQTEVSVEGRIAGSPLYMSPEQATGRVPDHRSDIYSLGAVMFFLLSGRPPFVAENAMQVMIAHARDVPPDLKQLQPQLHPRLCQITMKCLAKDPADRFQTSLELKRALEEIPLELVWDDERARQWWAELDEETRGLIHRRVVGQAEGSQSQELPGS